MANPTLFQLATTTVGAGGVSSVTFSAIPQVYTDLKLVASARGTNASASLTAVLYLNGDTSAGSWKYLYGNGSSAGSSGTSGYIDGGIIPAASATTSTFGNFELYIPNYTSNTYKSMYLDAVSENNSSTADMGLRAILWSNTSAITQIGFSLGAGNFAQYSTFTLYGVRNY